MKLRIAICDDEQSHIERLKTIITEWANSNAHSCYIAEFPSAEAFLFEYSENNNFDILLLDIEMSGQSGVSLAKQLRRDGETCEIIFTTSHFEFYAEGYEVDALHFLIKPIERDKLYNVLTKAAAKLAVSPPFVIINCEGETIKLYESEIIYIESFLHYIVIHTKSRDYKIKENLSSFAEKLSDDFFRPHRSYIVSLKHITRISRTSISADNGHTIPLSRGKYDEINSAYIDRN